MSVLLNVYNFVEPKIFKLINYEKEKYVDTISTSNENLIMGLIYLNLIPFQNQFNLIVNQKYLLHL